jgi:malate synthase
MNTAQGDRSSGIQLLPPLEGPTAEILTKEALQFVVELERRFGARRRELLELRARRQERIERGMLPDFLTESAGIRERDWQVAPLPEDLLDRRVEITGPVDRKMIINALNSGASTFMADFEDSNAPTWTNLMAGHVNLREAIRRTIRFTDPTTSRTYELNAQVAVLLVRPRGWHLVEKHLQVDGQPMSASLFDFGLYCFHNAKELLARGSGPYFYLPKLESHLEARLWNEVFLYAQQALGVPPGTIKATVLIETIFATFEMDEMLYELREHSAGLNCGRWDYIFSFIKKFANDPAAVFPDRSRVTMTTPFMRAYTRFVIQTCHRRGVHAIGGMSAYIPNKRDADANRIALEQVRADKEREATDGHDGTWVAHPGLVALAKEIFDRRMPQANQIDRKLSDFRVTAAELLEVPRDEITEAGVRQNVAVGIGYLESWLRGVGCVPLFNLMEDAATAEICRAQLWQWSHHRVGMSDGRTVTSAYCFEVIADELGKQRHTIGEERYRAGRYEDAAALLRELLQSDKFIDFLTLPAYERLEAREAKAYRQPANH